MDNADAYLADLARQGIPATEGEAALVRMVWKEATERAAGLAETARVFVPFTGDHAVTYAGVWAAREMAERIAGLIRGG